jgi:hypothetical protein
MSMTRTEESIAIATTPGPTLLLAFELGERVWKLGFTTGLRQRPRVRQIPARATDRVLEEIARARVRLRAPAGAPVVSCYEAGREAFCLHRWRRVAAQATPPRRRACQLDVHFHSGAFNLVQMRTLLT